MSIQYHKAEPVELEFAFRALPDGGSAFEGYAAVFNKQSKVLNDELSRNPRGYRETLLPGAFTRSLRSGRRTTFVIDHDERKMVASSPTGALRLSEDAKGLHVESPWPSTHYTDSVRALHESGERLGMSIYFGTMRSGETWSAAGDQRTVRDGVLKHVSVLATMEPAYDGTVATFRALADMTEATVEDVDALMEALRDGRRLDEGEYNLLTRLTEAVKPEASDPPPAESVDEASRELPETVVAILAKIDEDPKTAQS